MARVSARRGYDNVTKHSPIKMIKELRARCQGRHRPQMCADVCRSVPRCAEVCRCAQPGQPTAKARAVLVPVMGSARPDCIVWSRSFRLHGRRMHDVSTRLTWCRRPREAHRLNVRFCHEPEGIPTLISKTKTNPISKGCNWELAMAVMTTLAHPMLCEQQAETQQRVGQAHRAAAVGAIGRACCEA